jgi:hypothetical protein
MRLFPAALTAVLVITAGCRGVAPTPVPVTRSGPNAPITAEEIERSHATDLLTAVQSLRPHWLQRRYSQTVSGDAGITVYLNDYRLGSLRDLRTIPAGTATLVQFLSAAQAQYRYGVGNMHGAIAVTTSQAVN